jgi:serine/threonine-protein kinase RsbW
MPGSRTELRLRAPVEPACLDRTHELLDQLWLEQPDVAETDKIMFSTAVLEVANNIVSHGAGGTVSVVLQGDARQLEAQFCDDGTAVEVDLDAAALPDDLAESGRGLALVRMAVDEFSYRHSDGFSCWHLVRHRSGSRRGG